MNNEKINAAVEEVANILGDEGRILLRKSGTEPVVRVMVEAAGENLCRVIAESIADNIRGRF